MKPRRRTDITTFQDWCEHYNISPDKRAELIRTLEAVIMFAGELYKKDQTIKNQLEEEMKRARKLHDAIGWYLDKDNAHELKCLCNAHSLNTKHHAVILNNLKTLSKVTDRRIQSGMRSNGRPTAKSTLEYRLAGVVADCLHDAGAYELVKPSQSGPFDKLMTLILNRVTPFGNDNAKTFRRTTEGLLDDNINALTLGFRKETTTKQEAKAFHAKLNTLMSRCMKSKKQKR